MSSSKQITASGTDFIYFDADLAGSGFIYNDTGTAIDITRDGGDTFTSLADGDQLTFGIVWSTREIGVRRTDLGATEVTVELWYDMSRIRKSYAPGVEPSTTGPLDALQFRTDATVPTTGEGTIYWDQADHTLAMKTEIAGTTLQIGQESFLRARNATGAEIADGQVVYVSGAQGNRPRVALALADAAITSHTVIGVATSRIPNNSDGYVTTFGLVRGIDLSAFSVGDFLYLSPTVPGGLTATRPPAPAHAVRVGVVCVAHNNGVLFVSVDIGSHVNEAHDVLVTDLAADDVLQWDGEKWVNIPLGYDDERFPSADINPIGAISDPEVDITETGFPGTLLFSGSADNLIAISAQTPHRWKIGTPLYPHIHWSNPTGTADAVTWELYYRICGNIGSTASAWVGPIAGTLVAGSPAVTDQHCVTSFGAISMTGLVESAMVLFRLYRRGTTDASSGTARLLEFDYHYLQSRFGTPTQF